MPPVLVTDRLTLRPFRHADAEAFHRFFADPVATRYFGTPHVRIEETRDFVDKTIAAPPDQSRDFAIEMAGRAVGKAGMWRPYEIGFFVLPEFQRRGIAGEALRAVIPHLFEDLGAPALTADVDPRNRASIALLTSLGFEETHRAAKTMRIGDAWCDSVYFRLPAPSR